MNGHRHIRPALLVAALALVVAACGDDGGGTTTTAEGTTTAPVEMEITVTATEFEFDPEKLEVPADTPVTITLVNTGVVEHDITIDELDFHIHAQAGRTVSGTITFPAGIYMIYCSVPGHHEAGMMGELIAGG